MGNILLKRMFLEAILAAWVSDGFSSVQAQPVQSVSSAQASQIQQQSNDQLGSLINIYSQRHKSHIDELLRGNVGASYDGKASLLKITDKSGELYSETVRLPPGIKLEIVNGMYIAIHDERGLFFDALPAGAEPYIHVKSKYLLMVPDPHTTPLFHYDMNNNPFASFESGSVSGALEWQMTNSIYKQEFGKRFGETAIGGKKLIARGPNRKGHYELRAVPTQKTIEGSLIYDPTTGEIMAGRGWTNQYNRTSNVFQIKPNLTKGIIEILEPDFEDKIKLHLWEVRINFNGSPDNNYTSRKIK